MKVTIQRKKKTGKLIQLQLSYFVNGIRKQVQVPGACYHEGDRQAQAAAMSKAQESAKQLQRSVSDNSVGAFFLQLSHTTTKSSTTAELLKRVGELWLEACNPVDWSNATAGDVTMFAKALKDYHPNTIGCYLRWLRYGMNIARKQGKMSNEHYYALYTAAKDCAVKGIPSQRGYLSQADIEKLFSTPLPNAVTQDVAQAFMLSYYTGLRYSDIRGLTPDSIAGEQICLSMVKTGHAVTIDLNDKALAILKSRKTLFGALPVQTTKANRELAVWAAAACVTATSETGRKIPVTFHAARHSCATSMLANGADITTISKALGHRSITTTMRYAAVVDGKRKQAFMSL